MKTVYAPDTTAALTDAARDLALAYPLESYALAVFALAVFARWAARFI